MRSWIPDSSLCDRPEMTQKQVGQTPGQGKTMSRFAASAKPGAATRHPPPASRSLSLNRWILPVAVLGNSAINSMARGYL